MPLKVTDKEGKIILSFEESKKNRRVNGQEKQLRLLSITKAYLRLLKLMK